jgi:hypothetical protein
MKENVMKAKRKGKYEDMRPNYDFDYSKGVRGKYYERMLQSSNIVMLEPDVARAFRSSAAVNEALRSLLQMAAETSRLTGGANRRAGRKLKNGASSRR